MIETAKALIAAVDAAEHDLSVCVNKILALKSELRTLGREEELYSTKSAEDEEVDRRVRSLLSRILVGSEALVVPSTDEPADVTRRRARIETISTELGQLELVEEVYLRALERPGHFMRPRRADADVSLVLAP